MKESKFLITAPNILIGFTLHSQYPELQISRIN